MARSPIEDRVVHTALMTASGYWRERRLMPENHACRPGFGTHRAVLALLRLKRRHRFALHLDVRAFFPSVQVERLHALLAAFVREPPVLALVGRILDQGTTLYRRTDVRAFMGLPADWPTPGRCLPFGALSSQILATHVYLSGLDAWVKRTLRVPGYVRYVDDLFMFSDDRRQLRRIRTDLGVWLEAERGLRLKRPDAPVIHRGEVLHGLGHAVSTAGAQPLPRAWRRLGQRVTSALGGAPNDVERSLAAHLGLLVPPAPAAQDAARRIHEGGGVQQARRGEPADGLSQPQQDP
ncbi:MAG: RNA-directed DNA polymerase [bacterium]